MDRFLVAWASALLAVVAGSPARPSTWAEPLLSVSAKTGSPAAGPGSRFTPAISPTSSPSGGAWRTAPDYLRLVTANDAHPGAYEAFVSPLDLDAALRQLGAETGLFRPPGAATPQSVLAVDAFGRDGLAARSTIARLYGARRARVARAPRAEEGRVVESWTFISPYPDTTLTQLEPGTLLIILHVP